MVNLAPLFAIGQQIAGSAIASSGTVLLVTSPGKATTHPVTLAQTVTPGVQSTPQAILTVLASAATGEPLPGIAVRGGDWRLTLAPTTADMTPRTTVEVTACRDTALVGRTAAVLGGTRDSSGAVYTVYARPTPL